MLFHIHSGHDDGHVLSMYLVFMVNAQRSIMNIQYIYLCELGTFKAEAVTTFTSNYMQFEL